MGTTLERRIEALESASRSASTMIRLDLGVLSGDDRAFIAEIGPRCETVSGKPDYSQLSVPELRRLLGIAAQMRGHHESA